MNFLELPEEVQSFFNDPSDFRHITEDGYEYGFKEFICLDDDKDYVFETKTTFVESWIAYYKIIDSRKKVTYRVDYENPSPFIVFKNKLYLQNEYNVLESSKDLKTLKFTCYTLK